MLVVDDEVYVCSGIADCLRQEGLEVEEATDGVRALVIAEEEGPSISAVVADVNMPRIDGIEMWKRMKPLVSPDCRIVHLRSGSKVLIRWCPLPGRIAAETLLDQRAH